MCIFCFGKYLCTPLGSKYCISRLKLNVVYDYVYRFYILFEYNHKFKFNFFFLKDYCNKANSKPKYHNQAENIGDKSSKLNSVCPLCQKEYSEQV